MAELGIEEAAAFYGIAAEAIWRAIQEGQLAARIDPMGRYLVTIPPPASPSVTQQVSTPSAPSPTHGSPGPASRAYPESEGERLRYELEYTRYLLAEVSHQRDQLEAQVQAQLHQLERAEEAQHELRVLIGSAMRPGDNTLAGTVRPGVTQPAKRRWWPF